MVKNWQSPEWALEALDNRRLFKRGIARAPEGWEGFDLSTKPSNDRMPLWPVLVDALHAARAVEDESAEPESGHSAFSACAAQTSTASRVYRIRQLRRSAPTRLSCGEVIPPNLRFHR
jgi:hypothetical protein